MRIDKLETWAGPGQAEALSTMMVAARVDLGRFRRKVEADLAQVHKTQDQHSRLLMALTGEVSVLKSDVSTLKTDMAEVKDSIKEILRRLPPLPADG